jgi:hypothetical protein
MGPGIQIDTTLQVTGASALRVIIIIQAIAIMYAIATKMTDAYLISNILQLYWYIILN